MALILNIDTAGENAIISICEQTKVLASVINNNQKDHAAFLQPAIKNLFNQIDIPINKLNAISVASGPGSYTGLRVSMASAKGLCYALKIPLITISTLEIMATFTINKIQNIKGFYCPIIDARRMEVFTAVYDARLTEIIKPVAMVVDSNSFKDILKKNTVFFYGSGVAKCKKIIENANAIFLEEEMNAQPMALLSYKNYKENNFADVAYATPFYLKEFYTTAKV